MTDQATRLAAIPLKWKQPPKEMIGKLPKANTTLDYVGHASVTLILTELDPLWTLDLICDERGIPIVEEHGSESWLWGKLTVYGHTRMGVGIAATKSFDLGKLLYSDLLKNAAMRFGIATMLWSKEEWADPPPAPEPPITPMQKGEIAAGLDTLTGTSKTWLLDWWKANDLPSFKSGQLTEAQAGLVLSELYRLKDSATRPGLGTSTGSAPADTDMGSEGPPGTPVGEMDHEGEAGGSTHPAGPPTAAARAALDRSKR